MRRAFLHPAGPLRRYFSMTPHVHKQAGDAAKRTEMFRCISKYRPHHSTTPTRCQRHIKNSGGPFQPKPCKAAFPPDGDSTYTAALFFENKGFCGFAKQNARLQRASRPQPEAGAVLRSRMPACSGQAGPSRRRARFCEAECPRAAGRQTPAGGGRGFVKQNSRLQRASRPQPEASAVLRSRIPACGGQAGPSRRRARFCETECPLAAGKQTLAGGGRGFVKPPARVRRAGGGKLSWPQHAGHPVRRRKACLPRSFGCSRRQSPPWPPFGLPWGAGCMLCRSRKGKGFRLLARLRLWQPAPALGRSRKERQGRGGKGLCAPPCGHTKNAPAAHVGAAGAEGRNTGGTAPGFIPLTAAC